MKLMLTSGGVTNASIHSALLRLLGKPVTESRALCVPTAQWGHPMCNPTSVQGFTAAGSRWRHSSGLGWASLGVLELTALPTIGHERWVPWVQEADVLLVDGGDATYLHHRMRESGLADLLPSLTDTVWVGISAGSMVMTPRIGPDFVEWSAAPDDRTLGVVDFSIFPRLDAFPTNKVRRMFFSFVQSDSAGRAGTGSRGAWPRFPPSPPFCSARRWWPRRRRRRPRRAGQLQAQQGLPAGVVRPVHRRLPVEVQDVEDQDCTGAVAISVGDGRRTCIRDWIRPKSVRPASSKTQTSPSRTAGRDRSCVARACNSG